MRGLDDTHFSFIVPPTCGLLAKNRVSHSRDLPSSLQQGVGFGIYINIGGGQK